MVLIARFQQGLVNVPIEHHPTIGDISSPTDMAEGDVKQIPKSWDIYQPLSNIDIFSIGINDVMVIISIGIHHIYYTNHFHMVFSSQDFNDH